jgi:hypothetical protein
MLFRQCASGASLMQPTESILWCNRSKAHDENGQELITRVLSKLANNGHDVGTLKGSCVECVTVAKPWVLQSRYCNAVKPT